MSVLVDTGVFYAHEDIGAADHRAARSALGAILAGGFGRPFTSDYILDETVTLTRARTRSHAHAVTVLNRILGREGFPQAFDLLMVTGPILREAIRIFARYADQRLSFTDATTIALVERRRIDYVVSFDTDFEGLVPRLDPGSLSLPAA